MISHFLEAESQLKSDKHKMNKAIKKISPELAIRLNEIEPEQHMRLIVILRSEDKEILNTSDNESKAKDELVKRIRDDVHSAKGYILGSLDSLGLIEVETRVKTISTLSEFEWVKGIAENQRVYPIEPMR